MNKIALIGKKIGMTREFYKSGQLVPVTVLKMEKARVIQVIDEEKRGYKAVQLGYGKIKNSKITKSMKGYFAIGEDKNSTLGIVFYEHGETPGLGAEVDKAWFQNQFKIDKGKKIFSEIFEVQKKRIYNALLNSSSEEVINFDNVLKKIING